MSSAKSLILTKTMITVVKMEIKISLLNSIRKRSRLLRPKKLKTS